MVTRLGGTILPNVQSERESRDSGMFTQALPTLDSSDTVLLDLFGVTKTISVEGFVIGSGAGAPGTVLKHSGKYISQYDPVAGFRIRK